MTSKLIVIVVVAVVAVVGMFLLGKFMDKGSSEEAPAKKN